MRFLLPRHAREFHEKSYSNKLFREQKSKAFEWYGSYTGIKPILDNTLSKTTFPNGTKWKSQLRILIIGCGNSDVSHELYKDGYRKITSIDYSETVIAEMRIKYPFLVWKVMDATSISFAAKSFDLIIDKALLDAILSENTECVLKMGRSILNEADRVLSDNGLFFCLTLAQDFVLREILVFFIATERYSIAMHEIISAKSLHTFIISAIRSSESHTIVHHSSQSFSSKVADERLDFLLTNTLDAQWFTSVQHSLQTLSIGRQTIIQLHSKESDIPRFVLRVVDAGTNGRSCGVLLVPQGREHEWIFSTEEGAMEMARNANFKRFIIVTLGRGHTFVSTDEIQNELNSTILGLTLRTSEQIPYLTVEEGLGQRQIIAQGQSHWSGKYVIEQVIENGVHYRRLLFLSNVNVIQSQIRLKRHKKKKRIDRFFLSFPYHQAMTNILSAHAKEDHHSLVIGLGGGCLPQYMHDTLPLIAHVNVCELDPEMLCIAERYFGFAQTERMNVTLEDGIAYVAQCATDTPASKHSILVDVDAKDSKSGMSCPPEAFVQEPFLSDCHSLLTNDGLLMLNVSSRSASLYKTIIQRLNDVFGNGATERVVYELCATEEDVNRVVFVCKGPERRFLDRSEELMRDIRLA